MHAAVSARRLGEVSYLEHGQPTTAGTVDWWTTEDVAEHLGVSASTIRAYLARDQMPDPDRRLGRLPLWRPETVRAWDEGRPRRVSSKR